MQPPKENQAKGETQNYEIPVSEAHTFPQTGWYWFVTKARYLAFIRADFNITISTDLLGRFGDISFEGVTEPFLVGIRYALNNNSGLNRLADGFCESLHSKLGEAGYRVHWELRETQVLKDGTKVGPGIAVFLSKFGEDFEPDMKPDESLQEAEALANNLKYYVVKDGEKILVPTKVERLMCGIVSGGPLYQACIEDLRQEKGRVLHELIFERVSLDALKRDVEKLKEHFGHMPASVGSDTDWENELTELMRGLERRRRVLDVENDLQVWEKIENEIAMGCPAFGRLTDRKRREIFHRVRVCLGLVDDE